MKTKRHFQLSFLERQSNVKPPGNPPRLPFFFTFSEKPTTIAASLSHHQRRRSDHFSRRSFERAIVCVWNDVVKTTWFAGAGISGKFLKGKIERGYRKQKSRKNIDSIIIICC